MEDSESKDASANLTTISETKSGSYKLKNSSANIMGNN